MRTSKWIVKGIIGVQILLSSCTSIYINEISKSPSFNANSRTAIVVGIDGLILNEFIKTFDNKYRQKRDFINNYINSFSSKLQNEKIFVNVNADDSNQWNLIKSFAGAKDDFKTIDSLYNNCNADYIINISNFEISNRFQTSSTVGSPNIPGGTTSVEFCVIKARFQISDKITRKSILEFEAKGESSVFLFAFEKAFINAMENSIDHAIAYLKTGKKEF